MKGKVHLLIGAAAPWGTAASGMQTGQILTLSVISAGMSLGPDIDTPCSLVSQTLGRRVHLFAHDLSRQVREATSTPRDTYSASNPPFEGYDPDHRGLTHTAASAGAVALAAYALASAPYGVVPLVLLAVWMCRRAIPSRLAPAALAAAPVLAALTVPSPGYAAFAAGTGWLSHILADACTKNGVPLLWPLPVRGGKDSRGRRLAPKRWWNLRLLGSLLASGGRGEWAVAPLVAMVFTAPVWFALN